ncbi:Uncharacterised protein [Mycobacterium tuberculosis]|uniref:Uncharacterized protein n=1 Tax=Mycobacterium tuberculosis TaxID=1773 RepID=A0A654U675_MYCTX|nr:Uncharacterised protein [Mycobacterium tuberculosis]CFS69182.1 Uncharacterised protein [Mycobacterium tuberculosis]CKQ82517.1 Uncharacterised protein [Mycobacterium tuberculosis]CKS05878.1 Uncharacterised protein [Mycobacterium tuberculosis]CKT18260.1 Uncharacterised protein [Mycobacterium tuberculosis]
MKCQSASLSARCAELYSGAGSTSRLTALTLVCARMSL